MYGAIRLGPPVNPSTDATLSQADRKSTFWVIAEAVKQFYEKHGCLPLPGNVPDMKAQSKVYIQLQNIYKTKARNDVAEVLDTVRRSPGGEDIDPSEVELFCKNAAFVKLVSKEGVAADHLPTVTSKYFTYQSIRSCTARGLLLTRETEEQLAQDETAQMMSMPLSLIPIYLALYATSHNAQASSDEILKAIGNIDPGAVENERIVSAAKEVAHAGGGELHNTSALTGGMVAQEMIKIITKQYVPVDNTCIFDGIGSRCQVLRL